MDLQPLGDRLIVEVLEDEETTISGIVLPDTAKEKPQRGRVLAVGPGARNDKGELIAPIVRNGLSAMPPSDLTDLQISDIAAFIHSFRVAGYDVSRLRPATIVVGDANAGEAYFRARCAGCHEVTGDLKSFGVRFPDARTLQQWWLMPGAGRCSTRI